MKKNVSLWNISRWYFLMTFLMITFAGKSQTCVGNKFTNGSLESGTFAASTKNGVTTQMTTFGGSQSVYLPFTASGVWDHPVDGFAANVGYWVDGTTNGGTGAKDQNRFFAIPSNFGANRCLWPTAGYGVVMTKDQCYRVCFWAAQFDPAQPNANVTSTFNFEMYDGWGSTTPAATVANFSVTPTSTTGDYVKFTLPASTNVKDITGAAYTGASGQVVDWKTLNWQYICLDVTPLVESSRFEIYISTDGGQDNGFAVDGLCAVACGTNSCVTPSGIQLAKTAPTCTGSTANNNGKITLISATNTDKCGISAAGAATYNGPAYASATAYAANKDVKTLIPNTGGTYILRLYNGSDNCYKDTTITVAAVTCTAVDCNCSNNLITTPSFEGSDLSAWTQATNDPGGTILFSNDNPYAVCGSWYGYIRSANADAYYASVYQNVNTTAGTSFTLNVYGGTHDPGQDSQIRLQFFNASNTLLSGGQTVQVDTDVDVAPFTLGKYTLTGTAPAGTAYVRVTFYTQGTYNGDNMAFKFDQVCLQATATACSQPIAVVSPQKQTICVGGTATAYTATPSTGVDYKWYGPLASTSGSLGTAISGATNATFTPSGAALTTSGTKYYAVVVNTTGDVTCADTAFVQLDVRSLTITANASSCTPATNKFSVSGQVTFTAPPSTGLLRVRIPGKGYQDFLPPFTSPISYTIPDLNSDGMADTVEVMFSDGVCKQTAIYTAPAMCLPNACTGTEVAGKSEYKFMVPLKRTNWSDTLALPKFDTMGGTRTLKNVLLTVNQSIVNWGVAESTDNASSEVNIETTGTTTFKLDGVNFETNSFTATNYPKNVTSAVLVPAVGTWPGDNTFVSPPSTLLAMSAAVNNDLNNLVDPTLSSTWVTNQTGDLTDDDDMTYFPPVYSDNTKCWLYSSSTDLAKFTGTGNAEFIARATGASSVSGSGNLNSIIKTSASAEITVTYIYCSTACVKPVASATPQKQTICVGGTASAFTATPSTGVEYKWYGPLTSTSGSLGTAISGATNATFTPSGAALSTSGTKYYAVVVNTTGDVTCADTAFVQLDVSKITVPAVTALCHANGTPESGTDDYMTFSIHVSTEPMSTNKFTVTATQGGNPLAITLSNGSAATAINCGLNTPLRTPAGSAGKGNVTLTITDNVTGCSTTLVVTDPGTCAVTCVQGTPSTVVYQYATQMDVTELNSLPIVIPKFDEQGGTRVLQSVKLEYTVGGKTAFVFENRAAQSQSFNAKASSEATINLNGTDIATNMIEMLIPQTTLPGGILVPATGSWAGDSIPSPTPTPTTLGRMESWVSDYLTVFKDPRTDARWVTNATGDATDDDDMYLNPMIADSVSGTFTYNTALALAPFIGTGNVPLNVSTLSGLTLTGGGGNLRYLQRTRAYASAKVTYTFECILCTKPVALATPKAQTICAGSAATAFTAAPSTGVEYKWYGPLADTTSSLGTAVSGATSATFTPSGAALTTAGTKYYAVVVNTTGDLTCADTAYVRLIVNAKPVIADGSATICAGETVDLTSKITNYATYQSPVWMVGTAGGTAVATPSSVKPTGTTTYVLVAQNAAGCKDTANVVVTVNAKPSAGKDTTLVCVNAATNTLATSITLSPSPAGGSWSQLGTTPATATISGNNVTGMSVAGTYQFIYTTTAGCKDTISVTVAPCAGCVKPNAGPDAAAVCQPTATAKLTAVTTGGTWAPIGSPANPSAASIDANGNITGLNAAGTYKFVYSVTGGGQTCTDTAQVVVNAKPNIADGSATICAGESVDLTSKITNYNTYLSPVWTVGTAGGTAVATPSSVQPTGTTTYVLVAQNAAGCKDTANVVVTVNAKPSAGKDTTLACVNAATNTLATSITLSPSPAGGSWSQLGTTPATATISGNNVTGMSVTGTYQFIYTTTAGCKDTISVTVAPCAGCVKPNAGPDAAAVCQPTATAKLTAVTTGGTWAPIGSPANPSAASIDANGNITGLNAAGTYKFVYSVTGGGQTCTDTAQVVVNAKPNIADGSATICAGESVDLTTKITNYNTYLSPVWTVGTAGGTAVATPSSVKPTGTTTYVLVAQNAAGCKDTANVVVTVNAKPSAGKDTTLVCVNAATNTLATSITLSPSPAGGSWSQLGTTPTAATISGNNVTGMSVAGTYQFIYTTTAGCKDTIAVTVAPCAGCVKPNAGADAASVCQPISTTKLTAVTTGGTWAPIGSPANPSAATIDASGNISGLNAAGTYKFVYSVTGGGQTCTDTAQVVVNAKLNIADGSATICAGESVDLTTKITNYNTYLSPVWTVGTAGGTAVTTPSSVKPTGTTTYVLVAQNAAGCKDTANVVVTVNAKPSAGKDTTLVCSNGSVPASVQLSATPTGGTWSALTGNPTGATVSSSGLVSITNATAQGKSFDFVYSVNGCQDTAKVIVPVCQQPCIKSTISSAAPVCSNDAQTYSFTFTVANKLGIVKVNKGTLSGSNPYTVSGIPSGQNVIITDSLSAICKSDTIIAGVNCNCNPAMPQLLTPSLTACIGDTFPTLKATVVGLATVEWFSQQTGGTVLATGLSFKPSGTVAANTIFYAQARSTDPTCPTAVSTSRVPATINAQTCIDTIDLALKKSIDKKIARVGDVLTYTIKVWNEWTKNATGVEVVDSIATTVQFVSESFSPSRGSATISGNVITWNIGNISAAGAPANGDTVTLSYQVKATQAGVHLNTAEISKTNEKDRDSTPGNGKGGEDDIDQQCFTVPYGLCAGQKLEVSVPAGLTNVQWFKNGGSTAVATGNVVLLSEVGTYTFTATNKTCPANGCCPVIIEAGTNCCPVDICIPYIVRKVKK